MYIKTLDVTLYRGYKIVHTAEYENQNDVLPYVSYFLIYYTQDVSRPDLIDSVTTGAEAKSLIDSWLTAP